MDFGAGVEIGDLDPAQTGSRSGTPLYMAPEVFAGGRASQRSDIYSMGVLLYNLVTGTYPLTAGSLAELRKKHEAQDAHLLRDARPDLPEPFLQVVERALAWDPGARFETAGRMEHALATVLGVRDAAGSRETRIGRSRKLPAAAAIAALLLAGTWALLTWIGRPGADPATPIPGPAAATAPTTGVGTQPTGGTYSVQTALHRVRDGKRERLESGDTLAIGDRLSLDVSATTDLWVYVFNEDARGGAYALFPLPGFELQNPLPASRTHELPGVRAGQAVRWQVTSAGERERLIVLGSPVPLEEFERELARLGRCRPPMRSR